MRLGRRVGALLIVAAALTLCCDVARADANVPLQLQAQLVSKLASFDRNFAARAGALSRVLVLYKAGDADSTRVATNVANALGALREVGGVASQIELEAFPGAAPLAERCRSKKLTIVYFSTGLEGDMDAIGSALGGIDVLTVGATASLADRGVVVAFDLEEGRPKIVVNLARARSQNVAFKAELLKLARIVG
jgi:hypothetical protein